MENIYRKPLHLSLASMQIKEFNLKNELRMLKTALIYGDKVDLRSIASSIIITQVMALPEKEKEIYSMYSRNSEIAKKLIKDEREFLEYEGVRECIDIFSKHHDIVNFIMFAAEGWGQELGLPEPDLEQAMTFDFIMQLSDDFFSGDTIPFFDEVAGYWVKIVSEVDTTILQRVSTTQSKQIAMVSNLVSRLPLFEKASLDEIFDIRKELEKPLVNFRSEIIQIAKEIETAPWDKDFPFDVEQLFIEKVEPTILEIEDACKSNKLLSSIISNFSKKPLVIPATSALGIVLSTSTQVPNMLAQAISLSTGGAIIASEAIKEWREKQSGIEKNGFYFYYGLGKRFTQPRKMISQSLKNILQFIRRYF